MEFSALMPRSKPKVEALISNDFSISEYCRFARIVLSVPPLEGFNADFDAGFEQVDVSSSDGPREQLVVYVDSALWDQVIKTKDLQPELLRCYLQLKKLILWFGRKPMPTHHLIQTKSRTRVKLLTFKEHFLGGNPSLFSLSSL